MNTTRRAKGGFTIIELMVVVAIVALLMSLLIPALQSAMRNARANKDKAMIKALHQSTMSSAEDFDGRFISPQLVARLPFNKNGIDYGYVRDRGVEGKAWNATENLYSVMIMNKYITPEAAISPIDNNPFAGVKGDATEPQAGGVAVPYNFAAYDPATGTARTSPEHFWDTKFYTDLTDEEPDHGSWANNTLMGARTNKWNANEGSDQGCWSTRGVKCGYRDGTDEHDGSSVLEMLGPENMFQSHVAYADGTVRMIDNMLAFKHHFAQEGYTSKAITDNQFNCEFRDEWAAPITGSLLGCGNRDHWFTFSNNGNSGSPKGFCIWNNGQSTWMYSSDAFAEARMTYDHDPNGGNCPGQQQ